MRGLLKIAFICAVAGLSACSTKVTGFVRLVDQNSQPIPNDVPANIVVNMINTTATSIDKASVSATTMPDGSFTTEKSKIEPGMYKIEVDRIGYQPASQTLEVKKMRNNKTELFLRKIAEGKRSSIRNTNTDESKIINPGEVNIQPPSM